MGGWSDGAPGTGWLDAGLVGWVGGRTLLDGYIYVIDRSISRYVHSLRARSGGGVGGWSDADGRTPLVDNICNVVTARCVSYFVYLGGPRESCDFGEPGRVVRHLAPSGLVALSEVTIESFVEFWV